MLSSLLRHVMGKYPMERVERVYQLHRDPRAWEEELFSYDGELCVMTETSLRPGARVLPAVALVDQFGPVMSSSIAWMLADAIANGGEKEIHIFGVELTISSEYEGQRPAVFYLIGFARAWGIEVKFIDPTVLEMDLRGKRPYEMTEEEYGRCSRRSPIGALPG